jgi:hypothetical protein
VPGIESLLMGTSDLSMELGIPGQFGDERIVDAYRTVVEACNAHEKFAGMGGRRPSRKPDATLYRDERAAGVGGRRSRLYDRRRDRASKAAARLPLGAIAPDAMVLRFLLDKIHDLFYDTRIFGSVNSLTSR